MPISARELVKGLSELVSLPDVCVRVNEMTEGTEFSAVEIAQVISQDPGLAAQILRIANSPYYGFPARIDTISRAVTIIGNRELRDLVLATSVINTFSLVEDDLLDLTSYWSHCLHVGVMARQLGARTRLRVLHGERLFVAGLLHDIGRLVMALRIPELVKVMLNRARNDKTKLHLAEREVFDLDHGQVGAELMRLWSFPNSLQAVARFHHEPQRAQEYRHEVALVHIANNISRLAGYGFGDDDEADIHPCVWEITGLNADITESVVREANRHYHEAVTAFLPLMNLQR